MKISKKIILTFILLASLAQFSMAASSKVQNPQLAEHQRSALGKEVPTWLDDINEENQKIFEDLGINPQEKQIFVLASRDKNLDVAKASLENLDLNKEINLALKLSISSSANKILSEMEKNKEISKNTKASLLEQSLQLLENLTFEDLQKEATYWIKTQTLNKKVNPKKAKPSDYTNEYIYFSIYSLNKEIYNQKIQNAMQELKTFQINSQISSKNQEQIKEFNGNQIDDFEEESIENFKQKILGEFDKAIFPRNKITENFYIK